jgi:hypothetical protein
MISVGRYKQVEPSDKPYGKRVLDKFKMSSKDLTEIVTRDNLSLQRIIGRAIRMQGKDEKIKTEGISRKTLYEIASELGVEEKYVEIAMEEERKGGYDIDKEDNLFDLEKILNLKNKTESINSKKRRVHRALIKILKQAKRFKPKLYTPEEIEDIYDKHGIIVDGNRLIKKRFDYSKVSSYLFLEIIDENGNKKYKFHNNFWD